MTTRRELLAAASAAVLARRLSALPLADIKLGITTDEIDDDVLAAAQFLQQYHLKWAEIRNIWGPYNTSQPLEKIREANRILDEHGIKVSIEGTGFFKIPLPPDTPEGRQTLEKQWALLEAAKERAKAFGTDKIRTFTFMLGKEGQKDEKSYARIWELTREAARRAKGFRLAVENIGGGYVSTGAEAALMFRNVKEDNLGLTWDPNNAGESGEQSFPDGFGKLDPARVFHVHLRDYKHANGKVVWARVGDGEFDNLGQIRALLKDRYQGTFTLETHWRDPEGRGKKYSSEQSLKGLLDVIAKV
ncbi:MAG: sugar phosphate isomerase/epimerase [Acidobacteria bacterium]|nr:sugar phosphate isomerase/epimerase [Acidobacteriota bacterium]